MTVSTAQRSTNARQLWFVAPHTVEVRDCILPAPGPGELLVAATCSAISAGTELLVYRGQLPENMALDSSLASLQGNSAYPLQYGYATVGKVVQAGADIADHWLGKTVFAFQPHASHFITSPDAVLLVPDDLSAETAVLLANMETAVCLVQDGRPALGENVVVFGQGVVGLLLTHLLARHPLGSLTVIDALPARRALGLQLGAHHVVDPAADEQMQNLLAQLGSSGPASGADLLYEVTGVPEVLNTAIALSGFTSRIVIGSWYGSKNAAISLGAQAHRNRLDIMTSQVSTLPPVLGGRWDKRRRFAQAWQQLHTLDASLLVSHHSSLDEAAGLYRQLHEAPAGILQALIHYS